MGIFLGGDHMARHKKEDLIVGLDIGTTKICAIVAEANENGVDIVGIGTHPSRGLRKGVVVDIDATVESIKHAVEEAELMADCEITSVYAGVAGGHIRAFTPTASSRSRTARSAKGTSSGSSTPPRPSRSRWTAR
jgi:cell division ATPase FtsA